MTAPRILVVEDEHIIALNLREQLTAFGYDVPNAVATGEHALREIEAERPDLVLMDIYLKGELDGIATAAAIPPAYHLPVIYLTAYSGDAMLARAAATNPYGYLLKPFSERELHATIQVTLARSRSERTSRANLERRGQAQKMEALSHLAGGLAEEVNDLLTVLYGQLEVLGHHALGEPALAEPIRDTFGEAIEKERLIRRLLDFSGRRKLMPATVPVSDLVAKVASRLRLVMGDAVEIRPLLPDGLWNAWIDPDQLARALTNLAVNAREAMPNGGSLTIEGQNAILDHDDADCRAGAAAGRYILLSVADTGMGMTDRVVERAFEPFFTTKSANGGTGLGLSLVFGFIRQSGGHIGIDSEPARGTTVRLYLPAALDDTNAIAPPAVGPEPLPRSDPVEDGPAGDGPAGDGPAGDGPAGDGPAGDGPAGDGLVGDGLVGDGRDDDWLAERRSANVSKFAAATSRKHDSHRFRHGAPATGWSDGTSPVLWQQGQNALFASVLGHPGVLHYRLIVEPLPRRNGWDWAVWRPGDTEATSRHGHASSAVRAMAAAEATARRWNKTGPAGG